MPPDLREWVREGHLAHHVSDMVEALDLRGFYERYEGDGRRNSPYDPTMMVKVLIYGCIFVAEDSEESGRGCGVSDVGGRELSTAPDDL